MSKRFTRTIEDFICEHCGFRVKGNGYTNHCPKCLWSKHVDINPGDRRSDCKGLMEPVGIDSKRGEFTVIHSCIRCGWKKRNKTNENDDFDKIIKIMNRG
ncbi:MAG: RNHCP domain-containing protein [Patescibacteria group bacterium]|jgi:hypothetical protein